jgi:predicted GNAT family N-acyltransferase
VPDFNPRSIDPNAVEISVITTAQQMEAALTVRYRVFVEEQRVPIEEEIDGYDDRPGQRDDVVHVLAHIGGIPVGTARLLLDHADPYPHVGRVAVLAEMRTLGIGRRIMEALHEEARTRGHGGITLSAQLHAIPFYERLGYAARGPVYLDAGIEHRDMNLAFE